MTQMVFQDPYGSLHPRQTVDQILALPLAIHRLGTAARRASPRRLPKSASAASTATAIRTSSPAASASASPSPAP